MNDRASIEVTADRSGRVVHDGQLAAAPLQGQRRGELRAGRETAIVALAMESGSCAQALAAAINAEPGLSARTYGSISALRGASRPDVAVVDQAYVRGDVVQLLEKWADLPLVVVGDELPLLVGAETFVTWGASVEQLMSTIYRMLRGPAYVDVAARLERLSPREREILDLLLAGHSRSDIAAELYLSSNTVRTHLGRIYSKLEASSQAEAVALAWSAGARPQIRQTAGCS